MNLTGLHLLLTYRCTLECDHCFVFGSPWQSGVMSQAQLKEIFQQAAELGTIRTIYFEGGEPFLYYATLLWGVQEAARLGFQTGIVSNGFWATTEEDGMAALAPFAGLIQDLTVSSDLFHWGVAPHTPASNAMAAAKRLGIPVGSISIARPAAVGARGVSGQIPAGESKVMYRGRAALKLAEGRPVLPWETFTACPHEDLREPGRVHLDPLGNLHICQGISIGNIFQAPLKEFCGSYDPQAHPICGPLLKGGPAELVRRYALPHRNEYIDACHLCYSARLALREVFTDALAPNQMYGVE